MLKRFQDLKVSIKLSLIVVTLAMPVAAAVAILWLDASVAVATAETEKRGLAHMRPIDALINHVAQHRDLSVAVLAGAPEATRLVEEVTPLVDEDFAILKALIATENDVYALTPVVTDLDARWQRIKQQGFTVTLDESLAAHTEVVEEALKLILTISDRSELTVNSELETRYLIDIVSAQIPNVIENLSLLRAYDIEAHLRPQTLLERAEALAEAQQLRREFRAIRRDSEAASAVDPLLIGLEFTQFAAVEAAEAFLGELEAFETTAVAATAAAGATDVGVATASAQTVEEVFEAGEAAIQAFVRFQDATQAQLGSLLNAHGAEVIEAQHIQLGIGIITLLLAYALSFRVVRSITTPVKDMMALCSAIGMGDFTARAAATSSGELGKLATSLNAMLDNITGLMQSRDERDQMQASIQKLLKEVGGVGEGDLTAEAEVTADMTGAIADSFNQMIGELRKVIGQVQGATVRVSMSAQQLEATTNELAESSEKQAAQIVDTSAAVEEMAASIAQVSENAASSAVVAEQSRANADQGAKAVSRTIEGMNSIRDQVQETAKRIKRLGESSQEVGEIVQLIGDIADRTSILALNASIQAAMAGEAGRGFAVVAEEVERLADRASEATKRIGTLIKLTQGETAEAVAAMEDATREVVKGSDLANEAGMALTEIQTVSDRLAQLIQAISDASQQQSIGSERVAKAMGQISTHTRETAGATKDTALSIGSLASLSSELNASMAHFKLPSTGNSRERAA